MDDTLTVREALPGFYAKYNLQADGGQTESAARIELTEKIHFYIPNFDSRRKALLKHDIHHLVTGYTGVMMGETEIATWEISSGCTRYWAAFLINLSGMMIGAVINLKGIWKAFLRGKVSTNLYYDQFTDEELLDMPLGDIRKALRLNESTLGISTFSAFFSFFLWLILGGIISILSLILLPVVLFYTLYILITGPK